MKINIKDDVLSDLIWMSSRYCIGRHTIASAAHAGNLVSIIKYLSDDERNRLALDIKRSINNILSWSDNIHVNGLYDQDLFTILCQMHRDNYAFIVTNENIHYYIDFYSKNLKVDIGEKVKSSWEQNYIDLYPWYRLYKYLSKDYWNIEHKSNQIPCFSCMCISGKTYTEIMCPIEDYENNPFVTKFIDCYDHKYKI